MTAPEPIAIIGSGCRFPGTSSSPARLWDLLHNPRNVASKVPRDRFSIDALYHPHGTHHGTMNMQESYLLTEDVRCFDAPFFNISAAEAESMDPQQRLLLETTYEALETAGQRLRDLQGSDTGVFCGVMCNDYENMLYGDLDTLPRYTATGTASSIVSNRASYFFDWHGPSITIDTACSSSLVAVHLAVKALRDGDCHLAVAAGTNLLLAPNISVSESKLNMLSPTGRSRMWDVDADGYARGDGVATVILKRLSDALADGDGDSVESVIRATDINQDGRSPGITMPSSTAQAQLIKSTYAKAGLDLTNPRDRCQYFEAHGTGTQAGDPREAAAIHDAFFAAASEQDPGIFVGSVKTVVGHTESTAGIAGLLKASLSLQHGVIPPNLHFRTLNPNIRPYAKHLSIPTQAEPWPALPPGAPRRASVNSFGFGGTNAHVILESHDDIDIAPSDSTAITLPFVFSATSDRSLGAVLERQLQFIDQQPKVNPNDLAWSLLCRRTDFDHRVIITAKSLDNLRLNIIEELDKRRSGTPSTIVSRPRADPSHRLLGVFTGQGAQWPQMGLDLISASRDAKSWMDDLQSSLDELPDTYRPSFSLVEELSAPKNSSRIYQAALSQPLCTALQILLVNFLRSLGIEFAAVVGHSSGEIGAAYAAGILTARDAIKIAHLRGHFAPLAGVSGKSGGMLAAGMSMEEAQALCTRTEFQGRVKVAACNSPSSVTLSGDSDAILEIEALLKKDGKFARTLQVDTAYHSHHMAPCSEPYRRALNACNIRPSTPTSCRWFSSVYSGEEITDTRLKSLKADYWVENMGETVLFSQSLAAAISTGAFHMILEVGPHPALKGPALQTMSGTGAQEPQTPYIGLLSRGTGAIDTFSLAIGSFWTYLGIGSSEIHRYAQLFDHKRRLNFVKALPTYPFDHSHSYWAESRVSRTLIHNQNLPVNSLLGKLTPDTTEGEWRWRNYLRRDEIPWLSDHCIQSQPVFPAAGYLTMAVEAATIIAADETVRLVEIVDFVIHQATQISDHHAGTEILFTLREVQSKEAIISVQFSCHSNVAGTLRRCASGTMTITLGAPTMSPLPPRALSIDRMAAYDVKSFYSSLDSLGYGYTGAFRCMHSMERKKDISTGRVRCPSGRMSGYKSVIHPALIDSAIQAVMACANAPGDGQLHTLHIPTSIKAMTINLDSRAITRSEGITFDAALTQADSNGFRGDSDLFDRNGNGIMQFEGIQLSPLMAPTAEDDHPVFSQTVWGRLEPDATVPYKIKASQDDKHRLELLDRIALFHLRTVAEVLTGDDRASLDCHRAGFITWMDRVLSESRLGKHPIAKQVWLKDDASVIEEVLRGIPNKTDIQVLQVVGDNLLGFFRQELSIRELLQEDDLFNRFMMESIDIAPHHSHMGDIAAQIAFRFPRMKILEIGGGLGSTTHSILRCIGDSFYSYTFTDASSEALDAAKSIFADRVDKFLYRVLDVDADPMEQDFQEHEYDLVIVSSVLCLNNSRQRAFSHIRQLIKPGGYLVALDGTNASTIRTTMIFGCLGNCWGSEGGENSGSTMDAKECDSLLRDAGFAGIDSTSLDHQASARPFSVFVSQAVDDTIALLKKPLRSPPAPPAAHPEDLLIIGGATSTSLSHVRQLGITLSSWFRTITRSQTLATLDLSPSAQQLTVLIVADQDTTCVDGLDKLRLRTLQRVFQVAKRLLWVCTGPESQYPAQSMSKGLLRCIALENPECRYQSLHVDTLGDLSADLLAMMLMRLNRAALPNDYNTSSHLWSNEPELRLENGTMMVPRICNQVSMNQRYMAHRRTIYSQADSQKSKLEFSYEDNKVQLTMADAQLQQKLPISIRVEYSSSHAVRVDGLGLLYVVIGRHVNTGERLLGLSKQHASVVPFPHSWVLPCDIENENCSRLLSAMCSSLVAIFLMNRVRPNTGVLIHEPSDDNRAAISYRASEMGVNAFFSTTDGSNDPENTIIFHERSSIRVLKRLLPSNLSLVAQLDSRARAFSDRLSQALPQEAAFVHESDLYSSSALLRDDSTPGNVVDVLNAAMHMSRETVYCQTARTVTIQRLVDGSAKLQSPISVVDWTDATPVPARVQPASSLVALSPEKTYLLVGMPGEIGQSICEWMVSRGARAIVLASRTQVEQIWLDQMAESGVRVVTISTCVLQPSPPPPPFYSTELMRIMYRDVTDKESTSLLLEKICEQLPGIGGVANGAMITTNQSFADLSIDNLQTELEARLRGTLAMDEVYSSKDLDFFVLFGSTAGTTGKPGHSVYAAASEFMSSVVTRRRERGLVGSMINAGPPIQSIGLPSIDHTIDPAHTTGSLASLGISELELHESFAEGIISGQQDVPHVSSILAGLGNADPRDQPTAVWHQDPRLWHLVNHPMVNASSHSTGTTDPDEKQLESASSLTEAKAIIEEKMMTEIRRKLHISADEALSSDSVLVELGVDSLVAVDLRAWFAKEFSVEIAVLKILGGLSIGDLVDHIADSSSLFDRFRGSELPAIVTDNDEESKTPSTVGNTPGITPGLTPEDLSTESDTDNTSVSSGKPYPKGEYQRIERLSYAQSRYWFLNQYLVDQTTYNVTIRLRIKGAPRVKDLEAAVKHAGMRHENLRTCYLSEMDRNNDPSQAVLSQSRFRLEKAYVDSEDDAREEYSKVRDHVYNLEEGEVARIRLVTVTSSKTYFLVMGWHHIAMDGASFHILLRDLGLLYTKQPLPPVSRQYTDFAVSQRTAYEHGEWDNQLAYWKDQFQTFPDAIPLLPMAKNRSRPVLKEYEMEEVRGDVSGSTMRKIKAFCQKNRCSPFHFFVALLRIYLVRLTEVNDICIGIADANRFDPANESTVGFLLNLLPLRFQSTDTTQPLKDILVETKNKVYGALQNSSLPFDKLLDDLGAPRSTAYSPLFQVLVDWQPQTGDDYKIGDMEMHNEEMLPGKTAYDLTLFIAQAADGGAIITFRLQSSLYDADAAQLVARSFLSLVSTFANGFDQDVSKVPIYGPVRHDEVHLGKGPSLSSKWPLTISRRIDDIAKQNLGKVAIKDTEGRSITYKGMVDRTNSIASRFLTLDLPAGSPVCLFLHPTADWIPCMLAIWKLNLVYVPLDLRNPVPRLATMVQDCQPRVIVCSDDTRSNIEGLGYAEARIVNISEPCLGQPGPDINNRSEPQARAVILYTSGTTGRPKGIQLRHSSLMNEIEGYTNRWQLGAETVLQQGAMTFNHSLDQMLTGLSNGGRVIVVPRSLRGDPVSLSRLLADEQITYTKATPSEYANWLQYGSESLRRASSWRFAFGGGEHLTTSLAQGFRALELPNLRLFNSYGPGEVTISCHKMEIDYKNEKTTPGNIYPVGYSLPNYSTYIVDKEMRCVPPGVSGEILIGGAGPCMGYLNMDELNKEKFIENPFAPPEYLAQGWTKAYRTFDRGYLLRGGELVIDGRLDGDTQVKIRGIRMELEDIENTLVDTSNGALIRAVVSIRGQESQLLVAFVILAPHFQGDVEAMLTQLRKDLPLPQYMCPAAIVPVDKLVLNVHGKVDRRAVDALPLPKATKAGGDSEVSGTLTATESILREIWGKVLHEGVVDISSIPSDTDFFVVGGSSVLLVKLQAMIHDELQVTLPLMDLFEHSILSAMAQKLEAAQPSTTIDWEVETSLPSLLTHPTDEVHRPSSTQQGLVIVLTGVTGFLGKALLRHLISNPAIAHVHAIAVRPRTLSPRTLPPSSPKLTLHDGDLSAPRLGLDEASFASLSETADLVIHSGANRSFWDAYPVVRAPNVSSTKTLLALAHRRRIPIHFLSSGGVAGVASEPPRNGQQGYVASKWASERVLGRAGRHGISAVAHRPNQGYDLPGPTAEWADELRALVARMRCVPTECQWDGYMDLVPVAALAEDIVANILSAPRGEQLRVVDYLPTVRVGTRDFLDAATDRDGSFAGFEQLDLMKWMGRAKREFGFKWFVTAQNAVVGDKEMGMVTQL
ncbi:hybrid PKS-NRPS biosynthetic cluster [Penicillium hispanicum]|uniref:hybrid PKS-NRPS biosynthetic cluster n=1 Tax=Penicillium hispanicum TaxID=1080232 RepID=UPI002540F34D|nr:hybrid PKS-NRPS biosynthetic cluster [Penicillium hispanicum]KAJ5578643.1 hybrid PKS-NRPS biosynthetic cluster [Penicillium hispanicum]